MFITHTRAKDQGQRTLGSKVKLETDGWTEAIALPPMLVWLVVNKSLIKSTNENY